MDGPNIYRSNMISNEGKDLTWKCFLDPPRVYSMMDVAPHKRIFTSSSEVARANGSAPTNPYNPSNSEVGSLRTRVDQMNRPGLLRSFHRWLTVVALVPVLQSWALKAFYAVLWILDRSSSGSRLSFFLGVKSKNL